MKGDLNISDLQMSYITFLSTPSGWRATGAFEHTGYGDVISIHALRVEDDVRELARRCTKTYFYPRPPDGGRPDYATLTSQTEYISIHALRVEGDCREGGD